MKTKNRTPGVGTTERPLTIRSSTKIINQIIASEDGNGQDVPDEVFSNSTIVPSTLIGESRKRPIFYPERKKNQYLFNRAEAINSVDGEMSICFPLNCDTEYQTERRSPISAPIPRTEYLTTQTRAIHLPIEDAAIYLHPDCSVRMKDEDFKKVRHPIHALTYIEDLGYQVNNFRTTESAHPCLEIVYYGHFLLAELFKIQNTEVNNYLLSCVLGTDENKGRIEQKRRLRGYTQISATSQDDRIYSPFAVDIDGHSYRIAFAYFDTAGLKGPTSYKNLGGLTGTALEFKDNFSKEQKGQMALMMKTKTIEFKQYAIGDLYSYNMLENNSRISQGIYNQLDIEAYYKPPKLTMGADTVQYIISRMLHYNGISASDIKAQKKFLSLCLTPQLPKTLVANPYLTRALLAKVEGGRCRNNRSTVHSFKGLMVDCDEGGAYVEIQRNMKGGWGKPVIIDYKIENEEDFNNTEFMTLREFLKVFNFKGIDKPGELQEDHWVARVFTKDELKYPQDVLASWTSTSSSPNMMLKYWKKQVEQSEANEFDPFNLDDGETKYYKYEVLNGVITHEFLDWLYNVASSRVRNDFLDKLHILAAGIRPKSLKLDSYDELKTKRESWPHKNKAKVKKLRDRFKTISINEECNYWVEFNFGDILVDFARAARKMYPKKNADGSRNPFNDTFKLMGNGSYGVSISKFTDNADFITGNTITAKCRWLTWYMEKALNGFQAITDGCMFNPNSITALIDPAKGGANEWTTFNQATKLRKVEKAVLGNRGKWSDPIYYDVLSNSSDCVTDWDAEPLPEGHSQTRNIFNLVRVNFEDGSHLVGCNKTESGPLHAWVNNTVFTHIQECFPKVRLLHGDFTEITNIRCEVDGVEHNPEKLTDEQRNLGKPVYDLKPRKGICSMEIKSISKQVNFHGSANYSYYDGDGGHYKFRSQQNKGHIKFNGELDERTLERDHKPAEDFLDDLGDGLVSFKHTAAKTAMIKPAEYARRVKYFKGKAQIPGDEEWKLTLLKPFSISQFNFNTHKQRRAWLKATEKSKTDYGQSVEQFFIASDGKSIDYKTMLKEVQQAIDEGAMSPFKHFDKSGNRSRDGKQLHPNYKLHRGLDTYIKEAVRNPSE